MKLIDQCERSENVIKIDRQTESAAISLRCKAHASTATQLNTIRKVNFCRIGRKLRKCPV